MRVCCLFIRALFDRVKLCEDCEGWFLLQDFIVEKNLCTRCDFYKKILDNSKKKHEPPVENYVDLTN